MIKKIYKLIFCFLIWMQALSGSGLAMHRTGDFLSPKLNIDNVSLKHCLEFYSKARIAEALKKTAQALSDIAVRNQEREFSPTELVIVLASIWAGKSLRDINREQNSRKPRLVRTMRDFFKILLFGIKKNSGPENNYMIEEPADALTEKEREEFLKHIKKTMSNVINNRFGNEKGRNPEIYDRKSREMDLDLPFLGCLSGLNEHNLLMTAI